MADNQQQAGSSPEDAWIPYIRSMYPDLLHRPQFFPPIFFNRVRCTVESIAGQLARVTANPPPPPPGRPAQRRRARGNAPPPPPPTQPSPAGTVFTDNPAGLQDQRCQDTDLQDDAAQYQCLHALEGISEVMMVISQMLFRKYLDKQNNPQHHVNPTNVISQLPSITHPSIPSKIADGECDIIVLHRHYGILVGEIKSVGGQYLSTLSAANQDQIIATVVTKAITQLDNQEIALKHLVQDMASGNIRVTKAVLLPNITSTQLTAAVNSSQELQVALCRCTHSQDVAQAVSRCLCQDHLQKPLTWWHSLWTGGANPSMSDTMYERLAARFCGPASTVEVLTACRAKKVLRTLGEAVVETGLRFSSLVLTRGQVGLLNEEPSPDYMRLQGPPGCGKTVVLLLKALQWVRQGFHVVLVDDPNRNRAVNMLMEQQLRRILQNEIPAAAAGDILHHPWNDSSEVERNVSQLMHLLCPTTDAFIVFDEVPRSDFIRWLAAVRHRLPGVCVWTAGVWRWDNDPTRPLPPWLEVRTLSEPLRCPPVVTREVARSGDIDGRIIPRYTAPVVPLPTEGLEILTQRHRRQLDHDGGQPWQCGRCADLIADWLTRLDVGQPGGPQYRDTWILCSELPDVQSAAVLVCHLGEHHHLPVRAVPRLPSDAEARDLALAVNNHIIVTDYHNVQGLERAVIIALSGGGDLLSCSRSTSCLCIID